MATTLGSTFSANLKRARAKAKLSQQSLGEAAGLSTSSISMLERSQREPSFATLERLGEALGVPAHSLLKG